MVIENITKIWFVAGPIHTCSLFTVRSPIAHLKVSQLCYCTSPNEWKWKANAWSLVSGVNTRITGMHFIEFNSLKYWANAIRAKMNIFSHIEYNEIIWPMLPFSVEMNIYSNWDPFAVCLYLQYLLYPTSCVHFSISIYRWEFQKLWWNTAMCTGKRCNLSNKFV